ncbi:MAG: GGDEF domain-containing protein [Planctomycetes bacterium]|nr:GGDEF domain-containing protein [Planctomycetota bacterium]
MIEDPASMPEPGDTDPSRTVYSLPGQNGAASTAQRLPVLVVLRGTQVGRRYLLNEDVLVLGRRADRAQLVVPGDPQVSGAHCRIERGPGAGAWQVVDLGSTNGTHLSGQRITLAQLVDGDRILVGETVLEFTFHDEIEEEFHRQVDRLMNVDDLTGLPVQRVFQQRLFDALEVCARRGQPLGLFMMDMDGLKKVNDSHGHLVGAHAIATVGRRLGSIVQAAGGTVSRFGGDEFSAFVPYADRAACLQLGERLRACVAGEPIRHGAVCVQPTMSIGVAVFPEDGVVAEALTRHADEALYRAKAAGRDRVSM